jgi:hypothetical protein
MGATYVARQVYWLKACFFFPFVFFVDFCVFVVNLLKSKEQGA